jgi:hypothetical protein
MKKLEKKEEIFFLEIHQKGEKRKKKEIGERKRRRGRKETDHCQTAAAAAQD